MSGSARTHRAAADEEAVLVWSCQELLLPPALQLRPPAGVKNNSGRKQNAGRAENLASVFRKPGSSARPLYEDVFEQRLLVSTGSEALRQSGTYSVTWFQLGLAQEPVHGNTLIGQLTLKSSRLARCHRHVLQRSLQANKPGFGLERRHGVNYSARLTRSPVR